MAAEDLKPATRSTKDALVSYNDSQHLNIITGLSCYEGGCGGDGV